jgi:tetratricopeptide (TPR) repeat protein
MQRDTFSYLVANPAELSTGDVAYLQELVDTYPFCQLGYTLLAKAAVQRATDEAAEQALRKAAAYALSRNALRKLLSGEFPAQLTFSTPDTTVRRYTRAPAEVPVPVAPPEVDPATTLRMLDYADVLIATEEDQSPNAASADAPPSRQQEQLSLIERFIQADPKIARPKRPTGEKEEEVEDLTAQRPTFSGTPVTESYARILEKQGKTAKAIETYEKLILKFPEKKAYFAEKIEALRQ